MQCGFGFKKKCDIIFVKRGSFLSEKERV